MSLETPFWRFVRSLIGGEPAYRDGSCYRSAGGRTGPVADVENLIGQGVLSGDRHACRANRETITWLKRSRLDQDQYAAQHRVQKDLPGGAKLNLAESPLSRLAAGDAAFLEPHQLEAGERVRRLVERAQLRQRVTMSYSAARVAGNRDQVSGDISDMALDARRMLADIETILPRDCAGAVLDVCGWLKGLQEVERDRGWPRRSAKLVLRIGLDSLAEHYGLGPFAVGKGHVPTQAWMDRQARPRTFE